MGVIKLYYFYQYDIVSDRDIRSNYPATRQAIEALGGVILEETEIEVPKFELDGDGFCREWLKSIAS